MYGSLGSVTRVISAADSVLIYTHLVMAFQDVDVRVGKFCHLIEQGDHHFPEAVVNALWDMVSAGPC